ncbi:MAG: ABC transporter ATP-binding protein [Thermodesulfobacteriota bacterium]
MSKTVITAEGLGKSYMIGHRQKESYSTLRDVLTSIPRQWWSRLRNPQYHTHENIEEFWALKEVDFEIKQGDRVGIIGRNGAGKSTLLKILSRIIEPTTGKVKIAGRVASLLEVGTGFHPELTGRENVFLNGAILGMGRIDIKKKFDEIIDFAEVEKFLDTPVKRYSSGMYVRLAFAVAAHLEPEILIVDEVLAVGDVSFQKKCIGKMGDVAKGGRTIIFVSHKMDAIRRLCQQTILIEKGEIIKLGPTEKVINHYLAGTGLRSALNDRGPAPDKRMHLRSVKLLDKTWTGKDHFTRNEMGYVEVIYDINAQLKNVHIVCHVVDNEDRVIVSTGDCDVNQRLHSERSPDSYKATFQIPTEILNEGEYSLTFSLGIPYGTIYDQVPNAVRFNLSDLRSEGGPEYMQKRPGLVIKDIQWETEKALKKDMA